MIDGGVDGLDCDKGDVCSPGRVRVRLDVDEEEGEIDPVITGVEKRRCLRGEGSGCNGSGVTFHVGDGIRGGLTRIDEGSGV